MATIFSRHGYDVPSDVPHDYVPPNVPHSHVPVTQFLPYANIFVPAETKLQPVSPPLTQPEASAAFQIRKENQLDVFQLADTPAA